MSYADELNRILADAEPPSSGEMLFSTRPEGVALTNALLLLVLKALVVIGKSLNEKRQIPT
jgi:hypothetical protein